MAAYWPCEGCQKDEHCYGTGDRPTPPELLAKGFVGGFICSCTCRDIPEEER